LRKSEDFIPGLEEGITERVDLPICDVEPGQYTSNGKTERTNVDENVDKTAELQILNKESLKRENALAEKDKTGNVVQHSQDFPLCAEGAWKNTSNKAETNIPISGPGFIYRPLDYGIDEDALYASVNGKNLDGLYLH